MKNSMIKILGSMVLLSSIGYAELVSANTMNKNSKKSSLSKIKSFEKQYPKYVKKLMDQVEYKLNNASNSGRKSLSMFIMDLNGFSDIKNSDEFRVYLELKLKKLNYRVKRAHDYIEIYW